jgi:hypothetical protein
MDNFTMMSKSKTPENENLEFEEKIHKNQYLDNAIKTITNHASENNLKYYLSYNPFHSDVKLNSKIE